MRIPWLKLAGIFLIGWIVFNLDLKLFLATFSRVDIDSLILSFLFLLAFILLKCLRWYSFLRIQEIRFSFVRSSGAYIVAQLFALVTPGKIGDFVKVFYLEKEADVNHFRAASSVFADRFCDLGMLMLVAFTGLYTGIIPPEYRMSCQIFGFLVMAFLLPLLYRPYMALIYKASTKLPLVGRQIHRQNALLKEMYNSFEEFKTRRVIVPLLLTVAAYAALFLHAYFLAKGLLISVSLPQITYIVVIGNIASLIPVSIGGIGPREAVIQALFVKLLNDGQVLNASQIAGLEAQGLAFSLSYYGIFLVTVGIIGGLAWIYKPVSIDSVKRLAAELKK